MIPTKYHNSLTNFLSVFGYQFSNITIERKNKDGTTKKNIAVPIEYSSKAKWLRMLESDNKDKRVAFTLPRLSFEIVGINYIPDATTNQNNIISCIGDDGFLLTINPPVVYQVDMMLNIVTKLQEDGMQILEQILPRFSPNETWEYLSVPKMNITNTVPVTLNTATPQLSLDPDPKSSEIFIWLLSFSAKVKFYGPIGGENDDTPAILKIDIADALSKFAITLEGDLTDGSIKQSITEKGDSDLINIRLVKEDTDV